MITILSATNRVNSSTLKLANNYLKLMQKQGVDAKLLSLEQLPVDIAFNEQFGKRSAEFQALLDEYILPAKTLVVIVPEYNGSFPGIVKLFIDAIHPDLIRGKKIAMVGVSSGRAGNLRGMEHLTGVFNYLGLHVHPNKLPVSSVLALLDEHGNLKDENTIKVLEKHIRDIANW
jgi:chromate reductase